jgi:hypothetical protein
MQEEAEVLDGPVEEQPVRSGNGSKPALSIRDRIRQARDERSELVEVEEWGETIEVRSMTGRERAYTLKKYLDADTGEVDYEALYPEVVIATAHDPQTGERIFGIEDVEWLKDKNAGALEKVGGVAMRLSGLDQAAKARAGKAS